MDGGELPGCIRAGSNPSTNSSAGSDARNQANARADPRFLPDIDQRLGFETRSLVAVPIAARGKVLGVVEVLNKRSGDDFTDDDASLLSVLATLCASALDYAASAPVEPAE